MQRYGITLEQYDSMFEEQNGLCAICHKPERATLNGTVKRLAVDHNHETGQVRGLLCNLCNAMLAKFNDNADFFESAAKYLKEN